MGRPKKIISEEEKELRIQKRKAYMREYNNRPENKAKIAARAKQFAKQNPEYRKEYYQKNKEEIYRRQTEYRHKNMSKFVAYTKKYRDQRRKKLKEIGVTNLSKAIEYQEKPMIGENKND